MDEQLQLAVPDQLAEASLAVTWHRRAVLMMVVSTLINSTGGLLVRSIESASDWQLIFWRGLVLALAVTGIVVFQHGKMAVPVFRRIGYLGLVAGFFYSGTVIFYILSVTHTTIANAVFTLSAIPFFTAVIAWVVLGERITITTAVAIACALGGIALMVGDGMAAGSVFGNVMAIAASVCFACFVVILRKKRSVNMLPATAIGSLIAAMVAVFVTIGDLQVSMHDLVICFVWGAVISSVGHFLVVTSSRHLGGAELTLLILIEFVLAPIWVWLLINEVPGMMTLAGGAIVLFAVAGHAMFSMRGFGKAAL
ncbi:MAG: DMT family transporter [Gammaproteobacteria bacterium]|nr:DMT family transporter [Gammaproteobacteria bacterium]